LQLRILATLASSSTSTPITITSLLWKLIFMPKRSSKQSKGIWGHNPHLWVLQKNHCIVRILKMGHPPGIRCGTTPCRTPLFVFEIASYFLINWDGCLPYADKLHSSVDIRWFKAFREEHFLQELPIYHVVGPLKD
jgi:hypothetical protein